MAILDYSNSGYLIPSVKLRGMVPTTQATFLDLDFLAIANDEMKNEIFPMIIGLQSAFFKYPYDYNLTENQTEIYIPPAAIGMKLNNVVVLTNANSSQIQETPMTQLQARPAFGWWVYNGFWMQDNKVIIYSSNPQTIRLYVYKRPNKLVPNDEGAQIASINTMAQSVTCTTVPVDWADGTSVCGITAYPGFRLMFDATPISGLSGYTFDLSSLTAEQFSMLTVGDWICLENESTIAQIPVEAQPVLAQATVVKCLESLGDREGMKVAQAKLSSIIEKFVQMNAPRVDDSPKKINNLNNFMWDNPFSSFYSIRRW